MSSLSLVPCAAERLADKQFRESKNAKRCCLVFAVVLAIPTAWYSYKAWSSTDSAAPQQSIPVYPLDTTQGSRMDAIKNHPKFAGFVQALMSGKKPQEVFMEMMQGDGADLARMIMQLQQKEPNALRALIMGGGAKKDTGTMTAAEKEHQAAKEALESAGKKQAEKITDLTAKLADSAQQVQNLNTETINLGRQSRDLQASKQSTESEIEKQAREIVELSAKVKQLTQQLDEYKVRALSNQDAL